jgi:hypothetical protein
MIYQPTSMPQMMTKVLQFLLEVLMETTLCNGTPSRNVAICLVLLHSHPLTKRSALIQSVAITVPLCLHLLTMKKPKGPPSEPHWIKPPNLNTQIPLAQEQLPRHHPLLLPHVVMQEQILALVLTLDHLHLLRPNQVPK